jgi:hypothetical protein
MGGMGSTFSSHVLACLHTWVECVPHPPVMCFKSWVLFGAGCRLGIRPMMSKVWEFMTLLLNFKSSSADCRLPQPQDELGDELYLMLCAYNRQRELGFGWQTELSRSWLQLSTDFWKPILPLLFFDALRSPPEIVEKLLLTFSLQVRHLEENTKSSSIAVMMAFAMGSLPTSLCLSHKPLYLGLCYSPLLKEPTFHGYVGAAPLCPAIQCTAHEESDTLVQEEKHHNEVERSPSWSDPDTPTTPAPVAQPPPLPDQYAGWPPVDSDPKGSWKAGALFSRESFKCVLFSCFFHSLYLGWFSF